MTVPAQMSPYRFTPGHYLGKKIKDDTQKKTKNEWSTRQVMDIRSDVSTRRPGVVIPPTIIRKCGTQEKQTRRSKLAQCRKSFSSAHAEEVTIFFNE
jgi:hypothetical protein